MDTQLRGKVKSVILDDLAATKDASGERRISGWASRPVPDRGGDIVDVTAFASSLESFNNNPVMLYMHSSKDLIGKWDKLNLTPQGLWVSGTMVSGVKSADEAWVLAKHGVLKGLSIGFLEKEGQMLEDGYHIKDLELLEISPVSIPMNQEALFTVDKTGKILDIKLINEEDDVPVESKGVISYSKYPTQDPGSPWDGGAARASLRNYAESGGKINFNKYRVGFTYIVDGQQDKMGGYKLPHHIVSGGIKTNLRGCRAVVGVLAGARGGMNLDPEDKKGVYNHVARHIKSDFGADVAPLKDLSEMNDEQIFKALDITAEEVDSIIQAEKDMEQDITNDTPIGTVEEHGMPDLTIPAIMCKIDEHSAILESIKSELQETRKIAEKTEKAFFKYIMAQIKKLRE